VGLFVEVSHLLDSRHLRPASYQDRVHRAFEHLEAAVANPTFGKAVGLASHAGTGLEFRKKLRALSDETRIVSRDDAVSIMRSAMDMAYRELGLHPSAVAVEFVYASTETHDRYSLFRPNRRATGPAAAMGSPVVGVGVEIKTHERGALIVRPIAGGPAAAAGLQAGDLVVAVDGRSLLGLSLEEIGDLITGGAGSRVRLQLDRSGRLRDVILVRRQLVIPTVRDVRLLEGESGIGYLRLDQFSSDSAAEMDRALWSLHRQGMRALVMDLRGNPGGLLSSAIEISDKFLPCGTIVSTRGRLAEDSMLQRAQFSRTWKVPLVVLVDSGSASASEIFAAAIQENRRGLVVGEKSYGKGTVQTEFPLRSVSASLRITTAKFYSPEGRPMAGAGVTPDIAVAAEGMAPGAGQALKVAARAAVGQAVRELARHGGACSNAHPLVGQR
jgi:carboxyl-terminal processing protease